MLGNGTDEKLVISILNDVSLATKLADDIYSFGKMPIQFYGNRYNHISRKKRTFSYRWSILDFLYNCEMAEAWFVLKLCFSNRTAEEYAKS